jgi:hypothetical protein
MKPIINLLNEMIGLFSTTVAVLDSLEKEVPEKGVIFLK